ncbi:hypothetical protein GT020_17710 [Glutamicibacter soli]|uniref:Peptidase S11 D-alanyl-D-alanine carboxypeptidase A N-terminal domain-containing protein n=1 Tax=Glutamicibacter soli TaxID=453836 RepID=A0A6L9G7Z4_9MICC|nr:serine hydrolase [Glutamicibacter soli]NAZ17881.1 hypothetical protein [Glutamicibacter soli]
MPNTSLGIPTPADSVKISAIAEAMRAGFYKVDALMQEFESGGIARGTLPAGTDLNTLSLPSSYGIWLLEEDKVYPNSPKTSFSQNALLSVMPSATFRVVQRISEYNEEHFRTSPAGVFGNWRTNVTTEKLEQSVLLINRGILPAGTDLNTLNTDEQAGVWILEADTAYVNSPVENFSQNAQLVVAPAADRRTSHRIIEFNREHFRFEPKGVWGNWRTNVTTEVTGPMLDRISALENTGGLPIKSKEAILVRANGTADFEKNADTLDIPASMTKMLTMWLARQTITDARLDEAVILTSDDALDGSTPQLQAGDVITFRDLFYLAALPSHNVASELLANRVGAELPGSAAPRDRFIAAMNSTVQGWGWTGANFVTASGLSTANKATPRQMAQLLWRIHDEDTTLLGIMGELSRTVNITGANARTFSVDHSIPVNGNPGFPEFVAGKTGTLNNIVGNVAMMVETRGVRRVLVTMGALPVGDRYPDARRILNTLGLTDLPVPGADLSYTGSHIRIGNTNGQVFLSVAAAVLPENASAPGVIPAGFRPSSFSYGVLTANDSGTIRTVQVAITSAGNLSLVGNLGTDRLRGMITWPAA